MITKALHNAQGKIAAKSYIGQKHQLANLSGSEKSSQFNALTFIWNMLTGQRCSLHQKYYTPVVNFMNSADNTFKMLPG